MSILTISNFYFGELTLDNFIINETYFQKGHYAVAFSEMITNIKPAIQAGSSLEVDGNLYYFNSNDSISGTPSTGVCYVKCYLSGSDLLSEFTNTAPIFNSLKNGWYGISGSATHRYILKLYFDGTNYNLKQLMNKERYWQYEI